MKGKRSNLKCKLFPKIYKQVGIVALIAFAVYIGIKTVQTQQRKMIEGFKEGKRNIQPREDTTTKDTTTEDKNKDKKESFNLPSKGNTIIINA
jgi:hypothetical protein